VRQMGGADISTPNGRHPACLFRAVQAGVRCLGRDATLIGLGHPSKYAGRAEWRAVVAQAKTLFGDVLGGVLAAASHFPYGLLHLFGATVASAACFALARARTEQTGGASSV